jgi:acylphosphatase
MLPCVFARPILTRDARAEAGTVSEAIPKTLHIFVEGRVQGVGYREFVRRAARRHGLCGWVRNRSNGAVEARASGAADALDALVEALRMGPPSADVTGLEVIDDREPPEKNGFVIVPTL